MTPPLDNDVPQVLNPKIILLHGTVSSMQRAVRMLLEDSKISF